ncbi:MAG: hypothetical protein WCG13_16330 [Burkholderiales bacterium]
MQQAVLDTLASALAQARTQADPRALIAALPQARGLLPALPPAFGPVLEGIEQRLQSAALFGEESCSFSLTDLHDAMATWIDRARLRLAQARAPEGH